MSGSIRPHIAEHIADGSTFPKFAKLLSEDAEYSIIK